MPATRRCVKSENRVMLPAPLAALQENTLTKSAEWTRVLAQLCDSLNQTAAEVERHEQVLASPLLTDDLSDERHISWQRALERFGDRVQHGQARVELAERQVEQGEVALAEHEEALTRLRESVAQMRLQLANVPPGL